MLSYPAEPLPRPRSSGGGLLKANIWRRLHSARSSPLLAPLPWLASFWKRARLVFGYSALAWRFSSPVRVSLVLFVFFLYSAAHGGGGARARHLIQGAGGVLLTKDERSRNCAWRSGSTALFAIVTVNNVTM